MDEMSLEQREYEWITRPTELLLDSIQQPVSAEQRAVLADYIRDQILGDGERRPYRIDHDATIRLLIQDGDTDFLWDRPTGLVFNRLFGEHTVLASALYVLRHRFDQPLDDLVMDSLDYDLYADQYISEGYGFIYSSMNLQLGICSVTMGDDVRLNRQEQVLLANYDTKRI